MNLPVDVLLTDEFAEFSGKITALHEKKKDLKIEFKKLFEKHKENVAVIDAESQSLQNDFNTWARDDKPAQPKPEVAKTEKKTEKPVEKK